MDRKIRKAGAQPLLTVAIPAYNVGDYLEECLQPLTTHPSDKLEVVIVNDGSSDNTVEVAEKYTKRHSNFSLISKENGGHGSAINAGLRAAKGKFFRLLDGDDIFVSKALKALLEYLEKADADIILTDYTEFYMSTGTKKPINNYLAMQPKTEYSLDSTEVATFFSKIGPLLSTTTFRTSLYKENPFYIDENSFYVDMEYNFFVYMRAESVVYLPENIYIYRLDREGQSMQQASLVRNYKDHEKVALRLAEELIELKKIPLHKYNYLLNTIVIPMCARHYVILTQYLHSRKLFMEFDIRLKEYPVIYDSPLVSGKIMHMHRKSRGATVAVDVILHKFGDILKRLEKK